MGPPRLALLGLSPDDLMLSASIHRRAAAFGSMFDRLAAATVEVASQLSTWRKSCVPEPHANLTPHRHDNPFCGLWVPNTRSWRFWRLVGTR